MRDWVLCKHQAAKLLRELGFTAEVNARIAEANGTVHAIDVLGRRTVAGIG